MERRTQTRFQVQVRADLRLPGQETPLEALSRDLSWGGALFVTSEPLSADPQTTITVELPWKPGERILADAQLMRQRWLNDGRHLVAVRFFSLSPLNHTRFEKLLLMMRGDEQSESNDTFIVNELELLTRDEDEWRLMLEQIATGRLKAHTDEPFPPGESIALTVQAPRKIQNIRLRVRVRGTAPADGIGTESSTPHLLMLECEHPPRALQTWVKVLLDQMARDPGMMRPAFQDLLGPPDAPLSAQDAHLSTARQARPAIKPQVRCALEVDFPQALDYLIACWGDVPAFETAFRKLVLGEDETSEPWPLEVWNELHLLQGIHDLAYGISESRRSALKVGRAVI